MSENANICRVFVCSGRVRNGAVANDFATDVLGCIAQCISVNPYTWTVTFRPVPVGVNDSNDLEIGFTPDAGDGSATALGAGMRPFNITNASFNIGFYTNAGVAMTGSGAGGWFSVWRRPKQ